MIMNIRLMRYGAGNGSAGSKNPEPNEAVHFLHNIAAYHYECGDVIEDGSTVEGIHHEKWVCRREDSMAGSGRMVLDINSREYAGGNRE